MKTNPDVIVIGAGGGGPVIAKELGNQESVFKCLKPDPGMGTRIGSSLI